MGFEYAEPNEALGGAIGTWKIISGIAIAFPIRVLLPLPKIPLPRDKVIFFELGD
jgi:predicted RNA methylase